MKDGGTEGAQTVCQPDLGTDPELPLISLLTRASCLNAPDLSKTEVPSLLHSTDLIWRLLCARPCSPCWAPSVNREGGAGLCPRDAHALGVMAAPLTYVKEITFDTVSGT